MNKFNLNISFKDRKLRFPQGEEVRFHDGLIHQWPVSNINRGRKPRNYQNNQNRPKITLSQRARADTHTRNDNREMTFHREIPVNSETLKGHRHAYHTPNRKLDLQQATRPVRLVRGKTVPPQSEVIMIAKVSNKYQPKSGSIGILEPNLIDEPGILGAFVLTKVNSRGYIPVRLINCTEEPIHLKKNQLIGKFVRAIEETAAEAKRSSDYHNTNPKEKSISKEAFERMFNWEGISRKKKKLYCLFCTNTSIFSLTIIPI